MKRSIAIIAGYLDEPCQSEILRGIMLAAKEHSITTTLYVAASMENYAYYTHNFNQIQHLLNNPSFDGIILLGGAIEYLLSNQKISNFINAFDNIPIVNISSSSENTTNVLIDNKNAIYSVVNHLISKHHCKKIAFVCGPLEHLEATDRLSGYKKALLDAHIPINESLILPGDFTVWSGEQAIYKLIDELHEEVDAIVCSDDFCAFGAIKELTKRGYTIPDDLLVTGFDDSHMALASLPPITTIKQPFDKLGMIAVETLLKRIHKEIVPFITYCPTELITRASCGCHSHPSPLLPPALHAHIPQDTIDHLCKCAIANLNQNGCMTYNTISLKDELVYRWLKRYFDYLFNGPTTEKTFWRDLKELFSAALKAHLNVSFLVQLLSYIRLELLGHFTDSITILYIEYTFQYTTNLIYEMNEQLNVAHMQLLSSQIFRLKQLSELMIDAVDLDKFLKIIENGLTELDIPACYILLYRNYTTASIDKENLELIFAYEDGTRRYTYEGLCIPTKNLDCHSREHPYVFLPLANNHTYLGHIVFPYTHTLHALYDTLRAHINTGLRIYLINYARRQSEMVTQSTLYQLKKANSDLKTLSIRDELTHLYNRRGFIETATQHFANALQHQVHFTLFYMDLDRFKDINDLYGHHEGDLALIALSKLLKKAFNQTHLVGRLGGDEFTALVPDLDKKNISSFIEQLHTLINLYNKDSNKPYTLSLSIGYVFYDGMYSCTFEHLLSLADQSLYQEKNKKKA